ISIFLILSTTHEKDYGNYYYVRHSFKTSGIQRLAYFFYPFFILPKASLQCCEVSRRVLTLGVDRRNGLLLGGNGRRWIMGVPIQMGHLVVVPRQVYNLRIGQLIDPLLVGFCT